MSKEIIFKYDNTDYRLRYTRRTVRAMEEKGFSISKLRDIGEYPVTVASELFRGAFMADHPFVDDNTVEEIWDGIRDKKNLLLVLTEMYQEPIEALMAEPGETEKNVEWRKSW